MKRINKQLEIRFAGAGGQGLQAAATVLGKSLIQEPDLYVCQSQNYGPESRGGLSYADLIVSRDEIDFPKIKIPQILVCMSNESFLHFKPELTNQTITHLIVDPDMVVIKAGLKKNKEIKIDLISATLASEKIFGNRIGSNMVLVGALHTILDLGKARIIEKTMAQEWPELSEKNVAAFREGIRLVKASQAK